MAYCAYRDVRRTSTLSTCSTSTCLTQKLTPLRVRSRVNRMNKHFRVSGSTFSKLEELGVRASAVLRKAGLPQGFIDQPRVLLNTEELFALWSAVGEVSANPAIGLQLGTETKTERFHPIGLAALSTENFGSAVDQMARYKQLTCPEEILQQKDDEEWSIQFRWLLAEEVEP